MGVIDTDGDNGDGRPIDTASAEPGTTERGQGRVGEAAGITRVAALGTLLGLLHELDDEMTLYVSDDPIVTPETPCVARVEPADGAIPDGSRYLLEVWVAREVLAVWSEWRGNRSPTREDMVNAVVYYAKNDAYFLTGD